MATPTNWADLSDLVRPSATEVPAKITPTLSDAQLDALLRDFVADAIDPGFSAAERARILARAKKAFESGVSPDVTILDLVQRARKQVARLSPTKE